MSRPARHLRLRLRPPRNAVKPAIFGLCGFLAASLAIPAVEPLNAAHARYGAFGKGVPLHRDTACVVIPDDYLVTAFWAKPGQLRHLGRRMKGGVYLYLERDPRSRVM